MKKVLIVTYYFPPAGGPGVQRVLKFVKYLPAFGWEPVVLTVEKGDYPALDESLLREVPEGVPVYRTRIFEPYDLYRRFTRRPSDERIPVAVLAQQENQSFSDRVARTIRANLFIPDGRVGWIPFAVKEGVRVIRREGIEVIFTSSPPQTVQLIGMALKQKTRLPWVADFRDPWTDISYYADLHRCCLPAAFDRAFERRALRSADCVVTVSPSLVRLFQGRAENQYEVISNGYDEESFRCMVPERPERFVIMHAGNLSRHQNPGALFEAVSLLASEHDAFSKDTDLVFIGDSRRSIVEDVERRGLKRLFQQIGHVSHPEAVSHMVRSALLLLVIPDCANNEGILTGKLFDYMRARKPILGIGPPDGDAAAILRETGSGVMLDYDDVDSIKGYVAQVYGTWREGKVSVFPSDMERIAPYSRARLTQQLATVFSRVCKEQPFS
ncbi:MAG: glycosyltransferase family 4 protein [Candidatus Latescibacterota bacterium]